MRGLCPTCFATIHWSPPQDTIRCRQCGEMMHPEHLHEVVASDEITSHSYTDMNDIQIVLQAAGERLVDMKAKYPRLHGTHARLALAISRCGNTR